MRYGLIGEKLGHSYSKIIHEQLADYTYDLIPLTKEEFPVFMEKRDFTAINVTIPYKQAVIPYLDEIDPLAKEIGAVNAIIYTDYKLCGYNTDFYGFVYLLQHNQVEVKDKECLILGSGGTSHTVYAALKHLGAKSIDVVSRIGSDSTISYEECYQNHTQVQLIVNTTPLGMYPNIDHSPLDLTSFTSCTTVVDVIFNPLETKLLAQGRSLGIHTVNGLEMLVAQAKQAVEYFLDISIEDEKTEEVHQKLLDGMSQ